MKNKKNLIIIILSSLVIVLTVVVIILLNMNYFKFDNSSTVTDKESGITGKKEEKQEKEDITENIKTDISNDKSKEEVNNNIKNEITNDNKEENITLSPSLKSDSTEENIKNNKESNINSSYSEDDLVNYFQNEADYVSVYQENESFGKKAKNAFVTVIDFIFYDREIKGYTFSELSNTAKLKIIKLALTIDSKIDKYFPNYKETIKDKYDNLKGKLASLYLEITSSLCETVGSNTCNQAKEDFNNMKESFGFTWELIKELAKTGSDKIKTFYESWRD